MKKFIIKEDERKHILRLYGLLKEEIDPSSGGTVTINNVYKAGWYTTQALDQLTNKTIKDQLDAELVKVTEFVKKYPNSIVSVKFTSQESALPNTDNEKAGYFKKENNRLDVGELSGARKAYIDQYIQTYFQTLKDQGIIKSEVQIPPVEYTFNQPVKKFMDTKDTTPWCLKGDPQIPQTDTQGYACTGANYKVNGNTANNWYNQKSKLYKSDYDEFVKEQNSSIEITVKLVEDTTTTTTAPVVTTTTTVTPNCAAGLKIRVFVPNHQCQNAEFFLFANKTLLYNSQGGYTANLNNNDASRGVPSFESQPSLPAWLLNPGYGDLRNGDGTYGYGYNKVNENGDIGGGRSDTFTVTEEQSAQIVKDGKIEFYFICTTDDAHDDIPEVEVLKNGLTLVDEKGNTVQNPLTVNNVKGRLFTTDACGTTLIKNKSKLGKEDENAYISLRTQYVDQLVSEREKMMNNKGLANKIKRIFRNEPDSKGLELSRVSMLKSKMIELLKKIKDKDPEYVGKDTTVTDANFLKYYNEFAALITPTGDTLSFKRTPGEQGKEAAFTYVDKTVNSDKLYGDIRRRLNEFYIAYDDVFLNDETVKIRSTGNPNRNAIRSKIDTNLGFWSEYFTMGT
jgi:hypothetical protein